MFILREGWCILKFTCHLLMFFAWQMKTCLRCVVQKCYLGTWKREIKCMSFKCRCRNSFQANIYLFKVKNRNIRKRCEICSKLKIKTPERRHWSRSGVFTNFEHISHLLSSVSIDDFEQVNVRWVRCSV